MRLLSVGFGSRLCENSDVELARRISVSISSLWKPITPATPSTRRLLRKQFCASLAQASFHTAWVSLERTARRDQCLESGWEETSCFWSAPPEAPVDMRNAR